MTHFLIVIGVYGGDRGSLCLHHFLYFREGDIGSGGSEGGRSGGHWGRRHGSSGGGCGGCGRIVEGVEFSEDVRTELGHCRTLVATILSRQQM